MVVMRSEPHDVQQLITSSSSFGAYSVLRITAKLRIDRKGVGEAEQ